MIAALALAGVLVIAVLVHGTLASQARGWLHYTFPGIPARLGTAVGIFANNCRELLGVAGLLLIAQLAARRTGGPTPAQLLLRTAGELLLAGVIAANVLVVGAAVGAYGTRMVRAMLPHGPIEVAAYGLALGLYLHGRHRPLATTQIIATLALGIVLLALAATLETFVTI